MLNSIRNVKFVKMQKLTTVYHCCLCFTLFDQTTMAQEQKCFGFPMGPESPPKNKTDIEFIVNCFQTVKISSFVIGNSANKFNFN